MRYLVYINDSAGIHTPSHPIGSRRAAEVFAAHRSRFRPDAFVIVTNADDTLKRWIVCYCNGHLKDTQVNGAFKPERVIFRDELTGSSIYALAQEKAAL